MVCDFGLETDVFELFLEDALVYLRIVLESFIQASKVCFLSSSGLSYQVVFDDEDSQFGVVECR